MSRLEKGRYALQEQNSGSDICLPLSIAFGEENDANKEVLFVAHWAVQ